MSLARKRNKKKSLCSEIVKIIHRGVAMRDDGLIIFFYLFIFLTGAVRARTARSWVRRIALTYVIEQLMERIFLQLLQIP